MLLDAARIEAPPLSLFLFTNGCLFTIAESMKGGGLRRRPASDAAGRRRRRRSLISFGTEAN